MNTNNKKFNFDSKEDSKEDSKNDSKNYSKEDSKNDYMSNEYSDESELESESESEYLPDSNYNNYTENEFLCKNICPALAKIMGICVESNPIPTTNNWIQPTHSGLLNSEPIIKKKSNQFDIIKNKIINYSNLDQYDMEFIFRLDDTDKFSIIKLFNDTNKDLIINLLKLVKK